MYERELGSNCREETQQAQNIFLNNTCFVLLRLREVEPGSYLINQLLPDERGFHQSQQVAICKALLRAVASAPYWGMALLASADNAGLVDVHPTKKTTRFTFVNPRRPTAGFAMMYFYCRIKSSRKWIIPQCSTVEIFIV